MSTVPERLEFKFCNRIFADDFIKALSSEKGFEKVAFYPATEASHFERYGFVSNSKKVTVVYDVKASMLSVTAFEDIEKIKGIYERLKIRINSDSVADKNTKNITAAANFGGSNSEKSAKTNPSNKGGSIGGQKTAAESKNINKPAKTDKTNQSKQQKKGSAKNKPNNLPQQSAKAEGAEANNSAKTEAKEEINETQGGLSFKKYSEGRFNLFLGKIKQDKKYKVLQTDVFDKGKDSELKTFSLNSGKEKIKLRFMPKKQVVQLQGKKGILYGEVQLLLSEQTDFKTAAEAHIKQNNEDTRVSGVERQLKKLIPNAVAYLSEQSKIDFTIGVIEILNSNAEHYDYSMLLLPPFRGLERLIMDLQHAQGVVVKMIGQAYEKEEGNYVLKQSYRRKIGSIVYAEVMAALYREYFETRNFYAHSAAEETENRMIKDKKQAEDIFKKMLMIVDYNCKKLSEIGFAV